MQNWESRLVIKSTGVKGMEKAALYSMLHIAFFEFELEKVWRVDEDNLQARKSYEKAGFVCEGLMRNDRLRKGQFIHRYRYSMLREEYQALISSL